MHSILSLSKAFLASFTQLDLPHPLRFEYLGGVDPAGGIRVEDRVDDVAAASLEFKSVCMYELQCMQVCLPGVESR